MPDTYTPILALVKPEVGASRDTWGSKWNANADALDEFVSMAMPLGAIIDFAGPNAPAGWLVCDGRLVSRTTYAALFAVIGTYWGAGDGSTTFGLPPTPGRASVGPGTVIDQNGNSVGFGFATTTGNVYNAIQQAHLPNYALPTDYQGTHSQYGGASSGTRRRNHNHGADVQGSHSHGGAVGGDGYHTHVTDQQGAHQHFVTAVVMNAGGNICSAALYIRCRTPASIPTCRARITHTCCWRLSQRNHFHFIAADGARTRTDIVLHAGNLQLGIYADGNHAHNVYLNGGGSPFAVLNPVIVVTKIIYAGTQAAMRALPASAGTLRLPRSPLRGSH